jgi:SAM-dependent methyltransferase
MWVESGEPDAWWQRNAAALGESNRGARDHTLMLLRRAEFRPHQVAEIGCSSGWRLDAIRREYKAACCGREYKAACCGSEPSLAALDAGRALYPGIELRYGMSHLLSWPPNSMDLVILAFVCHWIDRGHLARSIAEADRVLCFGGHLLITDFLPDVPTKVRYHHRQDVELWTYKQRYADCWLALGTYRMVDMLVFNHDTGEIGDVGDIHPAARAAAVLLRKEETYRT